MELMMSAYPPGKGKKSRKKRARKKPDRRSWVHVPFSHRGPLEVSGHSSQESASEDREDAGDKGKEEEVWRGCGGRNQLPFIRGPVMILAFPLGDRSPVFWVST